MKAIIGLGNPDEKYQKTRHNVGFLFVDWMVQEYCLDITWKEKFSGLVGEVNQLGGNPTSNEKTPLSFGHSPLSGGKDSVIFLKPQTYMNRSGSSVKKLVDFYKLTPQDIIIISDDVDMEFAKVRYRKEGSAGGHNGLSDIFHHLGTSDIGRIKVGIGRHPQYQTSDWVLSDFTDDEIAHLGDDIYPKITTILQEKFI